MIIRKRRLEDIIDCVDLNINSWDKDLRGIVSDEIIRKIKESRNSQIKNQAKDYKEDENHYVLEKDNKIIGIIKIKKSNRKEFDNYGEIQYIYIDTNEKRKGYGTLLINEAFELLKKQGFKKAVIGCLLNNPSNDFYKSIGAKLIKQSPCSIFDEQYIENIYEFDLQNINIELLDIVDVNGNKTGQIVERKKAQKDKLLHWEVVIFIINNKKQILLQKRSKNKKYYPNMWTLTSGLVKSKEEIEDAAIRELKEELGLIITKKELYILDENINLTRYYYVKTNKNEEEFIIKENELSEVKWFNIEDLININDDSIIIKDNTMNLMNKLKNM